MVGRERQEDSGIAAAPGAEVIPEPRQVRSSVPGATAGPGPVNVLEFEELARERLSPAAYDYIAGGADAETTVRANREAYARWRFVPRALVDVSRLATSVDLLGREVAFPVLVAPTAFHQLAHPEGEAATARAVAAAGSLMVVSTIANLCVTEVAERAAGAALWFQLYIHKDRGLNRELIGRAEEAGCLALCLTVDTPFFGRRDRDMRNAFQLPEGLVMGNLRDARLESETGLSGLLAYSRQLDPSLDWRAVEWLRGATRLPVVVKGVLDPRDGTEAVRRGAAAIIVSNHGGRQLDGAVATLDALPAVSDAVAGAVPVLLDGGVRRGTDVLKALALGARAVLVGRPILWGLAADGQAGVERVLALLRAELEHAMALAGRPDVSRIDRELVVLADRPL